MKIVKFKYIKIKDRIKLFTDFLKTTKMSEYNTWKLTDDKTVIAAGFEWVVNTLIKNLVPGLLLTITITSYTSINFSFELWIGTSAAYWLLTQTKIHNGSR